MLTAFESWHTDPQSITVAARRRSSLQSKGGPSTRLKGRVLIALAHKREKPKEGNLREVLAIWQGRVKMEKTKSELMLNILSQQSVSEISFLSRLKLLCIRHLGASLRSSAQEDGLQTSHLAGSCDESKSDCCRKECAAWTSKLQGWKQNSGKVAVESGKKQEPLAGGQNHSAHSTQKTQLTNKNQQSRIDGCYEVGGSQLDGAAYRLAAIEQRLKIAGLRAWAILINRIKLTNEREFFLRTRPQCRME